MLKMPIVPNPCSLYFREIMIIELAFNFFRGLIYNFSLSMKLSLHPITFIS